MKVRQQNNENEIDYEKEGEFIKQKQAILEGI